MILSKLTPHQSNIWIANLNKLINLKAIVHKYYLDEMNVRREQYKTRYSFLRRKLWFDDDDLGDFYLGFDGRWTHLKTLTFSTLYKVDVIPYKLMKYIREIQWLYRESRKDILTRLKEKWEIYASRPFQIEEQDLEMYQNIKVWHEELKQILVEAGVYDEAYNLDEDR